MDVFEIGMSLGMWYVGMPYVVFSLLGVCVESQVRMKRFGIDIVVKNQGRHLRDGGEVEPPGGR